MNKNKTGQLFSIHIYLTNGLNRWNSNGKKKKKSYVKIDCYSYNFDMNFEWSRQSEMICIFSH